MKELICIICPKGCHLSIDDNLNVTGNTCNRGKVYAVKEVTNPERTLTSTVKVINSNIKRLPVVTSNPIPKSMIFKVMAEINKIEVTAPIKIRDVIIPNVLGLGVDIIASKEIK